MNKKQKFIPPHPLKTPVLFLVFNRLNTTKQVFEQIKKAKPPRLYIGADGARIDKKGELGKVNSVRDYVMKNIDWDCEVKILFRDENLGCKYGVSSAIDWFFNNEEMGIILEDDCLPSQSFFWFCEELLIKYKDDGRIGQIGGFNKGVECEFTDQYSYFFSQYVSIWGWATWRRAWHKYDINLTYLEDVDKYKLLETVLKDNRQAKKMLKCFWDVKNGDIDTWDYQWSFTSLMSNLLTIIPTRNLIKNVGFNKDATHTIGKDSYPNTFLNELIKPLSHPKYIIFCKAYKDTFTDGANSIIYNLKRFLVNRFR